MVRLASLFLILCSILTMGCRRDSATRAEKSSVNLEDARARFAAAAGIRRADNELAASKSLDDQLKAGQELVKRNPQSVSALNKLAYIYIRKVRQTVDFRYNVSAEKLLHQALTIEPNNYDSLLFLSMVFMAQHRFVEARDYAKKAIAVNDYGSGAYGILGDANYELGAYKECEEAYDKMGDVRPGAPYYTRVAWFRNLNGDSKGAIEAMQEALEASDPRDSEDYAWYLLQLGNLSFDSGKTSDAEKYLEHALQIFPQSYNGLAGLAKVKAAQEKPEEAIQLYEKAIAIVPMPEFAASLGDLYLSIGRTADAEKQYELVEYIGKISKINQEIYNRQLALFYADHDRKLDEALKLAQTEITIRKDIYGYDALAWCLYKNGKAQQAVEAIQEALRLGTKDPKLMYHAGIIYNASGRTSEGKKYLRAALAIQPQFHPLFAKTAAQLIGAS